MRARATAVAAVAVLMVAAGCSSPATTAGTRSGVGTRTVDVTLSGATTYSRSAPVTGGAARVTYSGSNGVESVTGQVQFPGLLGGTATFTLALQVSASVVTGTVRVADPSVGIDVVIDHLGAGLSVDGDGDAAASATSNGTTMDWALGTVPAPGLEPDLEALSAEEATFCQDAQQRLVGLDELLLPLASIGNIAHTSRGAFGSSKASLSPLQVQTWSEPDMASTANANTVSITHRISCKTRSSDHMATAGHPTVPDLQCRELSQRSMDLATAMLTPAELNAYTTGGRQVVLTGDRVEQTGIDWLTSFADEVPAANTLQVTAHSLRVDWNDPGYSLFPDSIRGVHYCTVWSPAWAYWWLTAGAFQI